MWLHLRERLDALHAQADAHDQRLLRWLTGTARLFLDIWRQLVVDQAIQAAAALAFTTLLSMVPLMAVSFAVFRAFTPSEAFSSQIREWLLGSLLADSVSEVTETLQQFLERAQNGTIGLVGFMVLLVTSLSLFMSVEKTFNRIWRVSAIRPLYVRLTSFYAVITLTPALIGLGFLVDDWFRTHIGVGSAFLSVIAPWVLQAFALVLMYKLLPHARVRWKAAVVGGVCAAVGFAVTSWLFNTYVTSIFSGSAPSKIYGSFSLIPVFFLWVYLAWIIILGGAEMAYMAQHYRDLTTAIYARRGRRQSIVPPAPTGYLLARVFFEIAGHFRNQGGGLAPRDVAERLQLEVDEVQPALKLLRDGGLVLMAEGNDGDQAVPALPLDQVSLARLDALVDDDGYTPGELPNGSPGVVALEARMRAAQLAAREALAVDVDSLLRGDGE